MVYGKSQEQSTCCNFAPKSEWIASASHYPTINHDSPLFNFYGNICATEQKPSSDDDCRFHHSNGFHSGDPVMLPYPTLPLDSIRELSACAWQIESESNLDGPGIWRPVAQKLIRWQYNFVMYELRHYRSNNPVDFGHIWKESVEKELSVCYIFTGIKAAFLFISWSKEIFTKIW